MIEFLVWLLTLPFQILGLVLSIVFGLLGAVISVLASLVGAVIGLVWAALCIAVVVLLVLGLIKLLDRTPAAAH